MVFIGYHASHEQHSPRELLDAVREAPGAGFDGAMCSDHLAPWTVAQGHSGFAWSWLGAALEATGPAFSLGLVTSPGGRYHPAVMAQALATLAEMYPGRVWAALGSGEALNEHVTGEPWPEKAERDAALARNAAVIRKLLAGEQVTADGVHEARVWSLPEVPPELFGAAVTADTASDHAAWADGLITVGTDEAALRDVVAGYARGGGAGPRCVQLHVAIGGTEEEALRVAAKRWPNGVVEPPLAWDLEQPEDFEAVAGTPSPDAMREGVLAAASVDDLAARIASIVAVGFDRVYLHDVGADQAGFLQVARDLIPAIRDLAD